MSVHVEQLVDDVLLLVMQYLPVEDVLACRLVCKHLGDLALHRDVWRHRRIADTKACVCAVLRLAPCLGEAVVHIKNTSAFLTTRCAVRHLRVDMADLRDDGDNFAEYPRVIRNQEALGRLRSLCLNVGRGLFGRAFHRGVEMVLSTGVCCAKLESLNVRTVYSLPKTLAVHGLSVPSLKCFRCELTDFSDAFVSTVLEAHADTLEEVDLDTLDKDDIERDYFSFISWDNKKVLTLAALLPRLPKLRQLSCRMFPGLEAVAESVTLTDLTLRLRFRQPLGTALELLRRAKGLRKVSLVFEDFIFFTENSDLRLIERLASTGASLVESLSLSGLQEVRTLARALPRLPALRQLAVLHSPRRYRPFDGYGDLDDLDKLLRGVTPVTAPALRTLVLDLRPSNCCTTPEEVECIECAHEWLHRGAVKTVLRDNPSLHVRLQEAFRCDRDDCEECPNNCHSELVWSRSPSRSGAKPIGLFAHEPDQCPSPEDHPTDGSVQWIQIQCTTSI